MVETSSVTSSRSSRGLIGYLRSPLVDERLLDGILDTLRCAGQGDSADHQSIAAIRARYGKEPMDGVLWSQTIDMLSNGEAFHGVKIEAWKTKLDHMATFFRREMQLLTPFVAMIPKLADVATKEDTLVKPSDFATLQALLMQRSALCELPTVYTSAVRLVSRIIEQSRQTKASDGLVATLCELGGVLEKALLNTQRFIGRYDALILRIHALSVAMVFTPLYVKKKHLFSIGYNTEEKELTDSYYDLLASEARQTSYISIARGEVPESHWFKMGRSLTTMDGYKGLVSWSGTMFEYLMPLLIMKKL